jgi:Rad3-related DNA helicase
MRSAKYFDESILNNPNNNFSLKVIKENRSRIELFISQQDIKHVLQPFVDENPDEIVIYFSNSNIYKQIVDELLADRTINYFQKLRRLEKRCPHLYRYTIKNRRLSPSVEDRP